MRMKNFWQGKNIFLTGHTGFKGAWLALWLLKMGAKVHGLALNPPTTPNMFDIIKIEKDLSSHTVADIRDAEKLSDCMKKAKPEIVFHLAAQPLVRDSYQIPVETWTTNVIGTINFLEAVRATPSVRSVVCITTDKCYENKEWLWGYRENEPLGGYDPYSSSKAGAEIAIASWRSSFFGTEKSHAAAVATARAGNVIGGGDWAKDRLIPDCMNALARGEKIIIRNPNAIRPWQHVLEPLSGYLNLAQKLFEHGYEFAEAWNFGPSPSGEKSVEWVVSKICEEYGEPAGYEVVQNAHQPHEAAFLKLDCSKAAAKLNWHPKWNLPNAVKKIVDWTKSLRAGEDMKKISEMQIEEYDKHG